MKSNKLNEIEFKEGFYVIDTRSFCVTDVIGIAGKLFILDSDPLTESELFTFLKIIQEKSKNFTTEWTSEISEGFWSLKYIYVFVGGNNRYYILNRYLKKINWKKILTV